MTNETQRRDQRIPINLTRTGCQILEEKNGCAHEKIVVLVFSVNLYNWEHFMHFLYMEKKASSLNVVYIWHFYNQAARGDAHNILTVVWVRVPQPKCCSPTGCARLASPGRPGSTFDPRLADILCLKERGSDRPGSTWRFQTCTTTLTPEDAYPYICKLCKQCRVLTTCFLTCGRNISLYPLHVVSTWHCLHNLHI